MEPTLTNVPRATSTPVRSDEDRLAAAVMWRLYLDEYESNFGGVQIRALDEAVELGHQGLIPPLVEITRFAFDFERIDALGRTLNALTGESFRGDDYFSWFEWLGTQREIDLLPGYADWKASLYTVFDPRFREFLYEGVPHTIPLHGIQWGGVARDGIPPLEYPKAISGRTAGYLEPDEIVFGVVINGEAKAYPFRIMNSHEMANDVVGGVSVTLSYCTLCGSGILWEGLVNGQTEAFGTSGFLYQSNKLMYDRTTNSLWQQQTGEPVVGKLAGTGVRLKQLPMTVARWGAWLEQYPETAVLDAEQGFRRRYHHPDDQQAIYYEYFHTPELMFPVWDQDTTLEPKTKVFGIRSGENARAYITSQVVEERVINDQLAGIDLVLIGDPDSGSVRAFRSEGRTFAPGEFPLEVVDGSGAVWSVTEDALVTDDDGVAPLPRYTGQNVFWFGWTSFFPESELWLPLPD